MPCGYFAVNMRKIIFLVFGILSFFAFFTPIKADIVTLKKDGTVILKVLSFQDSLEIPQKESLEIKEVFDQGSEKKEMISLAKEGDEYRLNIFSEEGNKKLNVTNISGDLIEIEERPSVKNLKIGVDGESFYLQEGGIVAKTTYPISIDTKNAEISIKTQSGEHFIAISPADAYQFSLRSRNLTKLTEDDILILEKKVGEVSYEIPGKKTLNFFNLLSYDVPVKVAISALTGEVIGVEAEIWMKVLSFFFG